MLWEGLKLMVVGMATVMIFLILLIAFIELVKYLTRNHAALVLENQKNANANCSCADPFP